MSSDQSGTGRPKARTAAAATYAGSAKSTLEKLRLTGDGPTFIRIGRVVVYDLDDIDRWLASKKRTSTSEKSD